MAKRTVSTAYNGRGKARFNAPLPNVGRSKAYGFETIINLNTNR